MELCEAFSANCQSLQLDKIFFPSAEQLSKDARVALIDTIMLTVNILSPNLCHSEKVEYLVSKKDDNPLE